MPIVNVPGVGNVQFPDSMSDSDIASAIERDILKTGRTSFGDAVSAGVEGVIGAGTGIALGLNPQSPQLRSAVEASQRAQGERYTGPSFKDVENAFATEGGLAGLKSLYEFGKGAIGQSLPYMAAPLAGGRLGAMAGGALGGPAGAVVGGLGGAGLASAAQFFGTNVGRQVQEGQAVDPAAAAAAAIPQAALDVGALKFAGLGRLFGLEGTKAAEKVTSDIITSYKKGVPLHAVKGLAEVPTEIAQQVIERYQAGLPVTGQDAFDEYKASAAAAGMMGPAMGTVGGFSQVHGARQVQAQQQAEKTRADQLAAAERARVAAEQQQAEQQRREIFENQQRQIELAALGQRMDEMREGSQAYAPLNAAIQARKDEIARTDAQKAAQSAFTQNIPDVFGEYRPEAASQVVTPETPETPTVPEGQMGLPFEEGAGQRSLFPNMMPAGRLAETEVVPSPVTQSYQLGPTDFAKFGFSKNAGIRKRLNGVDIMTPEGRAKFAKEIDKYDNGERVADWAGIEQFMKTLPPLEQPALPLEGGYNPTHANEVRAFNTEAPGAAVRQRYDASGARVRPRGPKFTLAQRRAIDRENAMREFMFAAPAQQTQPPATDVLAMAPKGDADGTQGASRVDAGGVGAGVGVPVGQRSAPDTAVSGPAEPGRVGSDQRNAPQDDGGAQVQRAALTPEPVTTEQIAVPPEPKVRKGGRKRVDESAPQIQVDSALAALAQEDAMPSIRQAAINDLYRVATDHPDTDAGRAAAERLDQDDITTEQTKAADKNYRRAANMRANVARNPDKFGAQLPPEVLAQPTNGAAAAGWLESNAQNEDVRTIAATINRLVDMSKVEVTLADPDDANLPPHIREALQDSLGLFEYDDGVLRVYIRPDGQNELTLLHELVHAATYMRLRNPSMMGQFKALMRQVADAAARGKPSENAQFFSREALTDVDEFVAYGFSSPEFRSWLDSMRPVRRETLWDRFVNTIKRVLGIPSAQDQTFRQMMDAQLEPLLQAEPARDEGDAVKSSVESSPTADLYERTKRLSPPNNEQSFVDKVLDKVGKVGAFFTEPVERERIIQGVRNKVVFHGATAEARLQQQFNGAIKDAVGNLRPDINMLQALHADNLGAATLFKGQLVLDKSVGGWWKAVENKDSMSEVFRRVHALEQKIGQDEARHAVQVFLLAARSDSLNKDNANIERQAQALEAKGKKRDAAKLRDEKLKHVHLTDDEIAAGLEYGRVYPELRDILDTYTRFKNNLIDSMVEAGRFSKEQAADLKASIDYVPFHRIQEEERKGGPKEYFRGLTDLGKLHKFTGSEKPVDNILDNMVQLSMWMVNNAVRNHAAVRLADVFGARDSKGELIARDHVVSGKEDVTVPIFLDGKKKYVEVGDALEAEAFRGIEPVALPIVATLAKFSDVLRKGTTTMPNFLVSQVIQDSMRAATLSGVKEPGKVALNTMGSFMSVLGGKDPIMQEMESYGIAGAYDYTPGAAKNKAEAELGLRRRNALQKILDFGESMAAASDAAQRKAIFEQTMKETNGDKALALYRAMEIINFKRQGSSQTINIVRRLVPFMNAYIQGMDVLARTVFGRGVSGRERKEALRLFWSAGIKVAALSTLYAMLMAGDEDYEKQDDKTKARNFFIPGTDLKLPAPADVGFFFKVIPELTYNYITSQGTDKPMDATKLRQAIMSGMGDALLGPNLVPQAFKPMFEVAINHSFFTGNPIIGRGLEHKEVSQQFTENTSELAKLIGQSGLVSPMNVDHIIRGTLGSVGGLLLTAGDSLASVALDNPRPAMLPHRMPVISTFLANPEGRGLLQDYYDLKDRADTAFNSLREYVSQRDMDTAREYAQQKAGLLAVRPALSNISTQIEKLRALRKVILADNRMSSDEKRARLNEIDAMQNRMLANIARLRQEAGL